MYGHYSFFRVKQISLTHLLIQILKPFFEFLLFSLTFIFVNQTTNKKNKILLWWQSTRVGVIFQALSTMFEFNFSPLQHAVEGASTWRRRCLTKEDSTYRDAPPSYPAIRTSAWRCCTAQTAHQRRWEDATHRHRALGRTHTMAMKLHGQRVHTVLMKLIAATWISQFCHQSFKSWCLWWLYFLITGSDVFNVNS